MASPFRAQLIGRQELVRALRKLGPSARHIAQASAEKVVRIYERGLRRAAPVRTGQGKRSIHSKVIVKNDAVIAYTGPRGGSGQNSGAHLVFKEYGFYNKRAKVHIPAEPWARPTFERLTPEAERTMLADLAKGIETQAAISGQGGGGAIAL